MCLLFVFVFNYLKTIYVQYTYTELDLQPSIIFKIVMFFGLL